MCVCGRRHSFNEGEKRRTYEREREREKERERERERQKEGIIPHKDFKVNY